MKVTYIIILALFITGCSASATICTDDDCFIKNLQSCSPAIYTHNTVADGFLGNSLTSDLDLEILSTCKVKIIVNYLEIGPASQLLAEFSEDYEIEYLLSVYEQVNQEFEKVQGMSTVCRIDEPELLTSLSLFGYFLLLDEGENCDDVLINLDLNSNSHNSSELSNTKACSKNSDCGFREVCLEGMCYANKEDIIQNMDVCCTEESSIYSQSLNFEGSLCDYYRQENIIATPCSEEKPKCIMQRLDNDYIGVCAECSFNSDCQNGTICMENECIVKTIETCEMYALGASCYTEFAILEQDNTICTNIRGIGRTSVGMKDGELVMASFIDDCYYQYATKLQDAESCEKITNQEAQELCFERI